MINPKNSASHFIPCKRSTQSDFHPQCLAHKQAASFTSYHIVQKSMHLFQTQVPLHFSPKPRHFLDVSFHLKRHFNKVNFRLFFTIPVLLVWRQCCDLREASLPKCQKHVSYLAIRCSVTRKRNGVNV